MHIGYVVKRYPRYSETFIVNEILAHEAAGVQVTIFALLPPEDTHFQDIIARVRAPVIYLPAKATKANELWQNLLDTAASQPRVWAHLNIAATSTAREILQTLVLSREVAARQITHLHAHFATTSTQVAMLAATFTQTPYSFTAHAKDIFHEDTDLASLKQKFEHANSVVTVSDFNVSFLQDSLNTQDPKLVRIYNGLDLDKFTYARDEVAPHHILAVGRLVEKKGFSYLIDACRVLHDRGVPFQCDIIGMGPLQAPLQAQIEHHQLGDWVQLSGARPQQDIIDALRHATVFVAPCVVGEDGNRDGLPTVLLEAMATGTPSIATDVTGIPELVQHEQTGLLVEKNDGASLADAIQRVLTDEALGTRLSVNARAHIEAHFDVVKSCVELRKQFR